MTHTVQLAVEYADHQTRYYPADRGWRIDAAQRCVVIGRDLPRTYVPLDNVTAFHIERVGQSSTEHAHTYGVPCPARPCRWPAGGHPAAEMVWLGDLSGYQLDADAGQVLVRHRCGWTYEVDNPVIAYLANLIDGPVAAHRDAGCNPHEG